jgi:acetyltransferase-like isoleucine patch superfamily enzyme
MNRADANVISPLAKLDPSVSLSHGAVIHENVTIAEGTTVGNHVVIMADVRIGSGVTIQDFATIGKVPRAARTATLGAQAIERETRVEDGATIGTGAVVYAGCHIGRNAFVGDGASMRENCRVGDLSVVGRGVNLEFHVTIGCRCLIFTASYLSENTLLEDDVFIGARVCTASGTVMSHRRTIPCESQGPVIRAGARIGTGACLHPGITVGREAVVALGAVVFENVPEATLVLGNPARPVKKVPADEFIDPSMGHGGRGPGG